jgi:hypothetical protein
LTESITDFETIKSQALAIARREQHERARLEKKEGITATWFDAASLPPPRPGRSALRSWAELAAALITFDEWEKIVWHCADTVKPFDGDLVSFFETAFEGFRLKDGGRIFA